MSILNLFKNIKTLYKNSNIQIPTVASLTVLEDYIELDVNGIPSCVFIQYSGTGYFTSSMNIMLKAKANKNSILITNLFKLELPKEILSFAGDIKILTCKITGFDGSIVNATIKNIQREQLMQHSETKLEDDSIVLVYESKSSKYRNKASKIGMRKRIINPSAMGKFGRINGFGKREEEQRFTTEFVKRLPSIVKKGVKRPLIARPVVSKPVVSKPIPSKTIPSISTPRIEEERKKY